MSTGILEDTSVEIDIEENEEEHFAHYAESAEVTEGYIMGTPIIAFCGKIFIPFRDPEKLRICPTCKEIVDALFLDNK